MKRVFFFICLLQGVFSNAQAHLQGPITEYVQSSKTVCVAKATEIKNGIVTFTVEEIIKGDPPTTLILTAVETPKAITQNSEWLLAWTGSKQTSVGWALKGDHGWVNAPIQRVEGKIHLVGKYGVIDPSLAADPAKGLTLEQLQELAKKPLPKY